MSTTLNKVRGESVNIAISLPLSKMAQVEEVQVYVGKILKAKKSDNTLIPTVDSNVFLMKLSGTFTNTLLNSNLVTVAVDYSDLGIVKTAKEQALNLFIENTNNLFVNDSVADDDGAIHATIVLTIQDNGLIQNTTIATIYRGYSSLELFRIERNLPNATRADMVAYDVGRKSVTITNLGDGATITHNLDGYVVTRFVNSNGEEINGVYGEKIPNNLNQVTLRTPILDDILNQTYTGILICERY